MKPGGDVRYLRRAAYVLAPRSAGYYQARALWLPVMRALRRLWLEAYT